MNKKNLILACMAFSSHFAAFSQVSDPLWMRYSSISPDGKTIAFAYKGDIYTVASKGGVAKQLTTNKAYDYSPVWNPDGKTLAFASNREGSLDIYITTIEGGAPKRVTTNSGTEIPVAFSDATHILYTTYAMPSVDNMQFPSPTFKYTFKVSTAGGRPELFSEVPMDQLNIGPKGVVLYNDVKGYEDYWRKHHTSSIARDIWKYDGKKYEKLTSFNGEDRNPVWTSDGKGFYYLSEKDGTFNIYKRNLDNSTSESQLTHYKGNPVRFLSSSNNGVLCYGYDGEIYTLTPGDKPQKVNIEIVTDNTDRDLIRQIRTSGASRVSVSPKGNEIAFIMSGDVYVTSMDYKTTKQITDTPELERTVDFSSDGRSIVYDSERNGVWQVYVTTLSKKEEKNFTYSTELKEECITDGKTTSFQPQFSPDGSEVAFLRNRTEICVVNLKSKKIRTVMDGKFQYSYADGDQSYSWSPDGKWLLTGYIGTGGWNNKDIALVKADGSGEIHNLTNSGYTEGNPRWVLDGKAMIFQSDRAGYRSHGSWGAERDQYIMFFDREAYQKFRMNKEELALYEEKKKAEEEAKKKEETDKKEKAKKNKTKTEEKKEDKKEDKGVVYDLKNLDDRTIRLTPYSTNLGDALLSKDGTKLYYIAPFEGRSALWVQHIKEYRNELKMRGMDWVSLEPDADVKNAYMASGGYIKKLEIESGKLSNIDFETFFNNRPLAYSKYLFDHIWKQTEDKLYDPKMNGADWNKLRSTYEKFLPHINNGYDFAEMASELLGELNVSHTGCRYAAPNYAMPVASLGVFYDNNYKGDGLKIQEIIKGSPFTEIESEVEPGCIIEKIDGEAIKAGQDYYPLLAGKAGRYTRLTISKKGKTFDVTITPISVGAETEMLYQRWVERNKEIVDKLSGGKVTYVHIKAMNGECFQELYKDLLSDKNRNKDAVIVDTRHNGGGWLHNDVCLLLSGSKKVEYAPRGQFIGIDPFDRWTKPSCMLVCEDNYSNAHGTPWLYKELGIGKLIGTPVPGTMTAVWWEGIGNGEFVFGIPQVCSVDPRGNYLENQELHPDIEVYNTPAEQLKGTDSQLEYAVKEMLSTLNKKK